MDRVNQKIASSAIFSILLGQSLLDKKTGNIIVRLFYAYLILVIVSPPFITDIRVMFFSFIYPFLDAFFRAASIASSSFEAQISS
ncbi:MAG: hypothetical protein Q8N16_00720 [bacterium]|nr:hypothetical protein [bacterium]